MAFGKKGSRSKVDDRKKYLLSNSRKARQTTKKVQRLSYSKASLAENLAENLADIKKNSFKVLKPDNAFKKNKKNFLLDNYHDTINVDDNLIYEDESNDENNSENVTLFTNTLTFWLIVIEVIWLIWVFLLYRRYRKLVQEGIIVPQSSGKLCQPNQPPAPAPAPAPTPAPTPPPGPMANPNQNPLNEAQQPFNDGRDSLYNSGYYDRYDSNRDGTQALLNLFDNPWNLSSSSPFSSDLANSSSSSPFGSSSPNSFPAQSNVFDVNLKGVDSSFYPDAPTNNEEDRWINFEIQQVGHDHDENCKNCQPTQCPFFDSNVKEKDDLCRSFFDPQHQPLQSCCSPPPHVPSCCEPTSSNQLIQPSSFQQIEPPPSHPFQHSVDKSSFFSSSAPSSYPLSSAPSSYPSSFTPSSYPSSAPSSCPSSSTPSSSFLSSSSSIFNSFSDFPPPPSSYSPNQDCGNTNVVSQEPAELAEIRGKILCQLRKQEQDQQSQQTLNYSFPFVKVTRTANPNNKKAAAFTPSEFKDNCGLIYITNNGVMWKFNGHLYTKQFVTRALMPKLFPGARFGIFINAFDPFSKKHSDVIDAALKQFNLDFILLLPMALLSSGESINCFESLKSELAESGGGRFGSSCFSFPERVAMCYKAIEMKKCSGVEVILDDILQNRHNSIFFTAIHVAAIIKTAYRSTPIVFCEEEHIHMLKNTIPSDVGLSWPKYFQLCIVVPSLSPENVDRITIYLKSLFSNLALESVTNCVRLLQVPSVSVDDVMLKQLILQHILSPILENYIDQSIIQHIKEKRLYGTDRILGPPLGSQIDPDVDSEKCEQFIKVYGSIDPNSHNAQFSQSDCERMSNLFYHTSDGHIWVWNTSRYDMIL